MMTGSGSGKGHVPDAQDLFEGDDNRRRATNSTLTTSLLRQVGITPLPTTSSIWTFGLISQFFTVWPSVLHNNSLVPLLSG